MEQAGPLNEAADDGKSDPRRVPNGGTLALSDARWAAAQSRAVVIARLAALESVSASAAREAGQALACRSGRSIDYCACGRGRVDWSRRSHRALPPAAETRAGFQLRRSSS